MTLAILILGLIIATSFIAYWADNLGKKLGKKRISLLGIRPKQTATLISIVSSVAIMLLTVGVLLAVSSNLRDALLRYDSAKSAALALQEKNNELVDNISNLHGQRDKLNSQLTSLQKESRKVAAQRKIATKELAKVRANLGNLRQRLGKTRKELTDLRSQLQKTTAAEKLAKAGEKAAKAKAQAAQKRYMEVAASLKDAQEKVESSRQLLAKSLDQLKDTQQSLDKTHRDYSNARAQLAKADKDLQQTQEHLRAVQQNFDLVNQQVKTTLDQYRDAVSSVEALRKRRDDLETQLNLGKQELAGLEFIAFQVATGNVEVRYGTVFAQTLVPSRTPEDIAEAQLQALLEAGQKVVQGKYTISLAPQPAWVGQLVTNLNAAQIITYWAKRLSQSDVTVAARLVAARDHAEGERDITTRFILVPIRTIFTKNQTIETAVINADGGDALIFNQLLKLVDKGEAKARERGSMPITTPESPFYAAGTNERIFRALRKIQTFDGDVKVQMIAAQNITTVDSMQVEFNVSGKTKSTPAAS